MKTEYSQEFKESMLQKILLNPGRTVVSYANEANIPPSTVGTWMSNFKKKNGRALQSKKKKWTAKDKFEAVLQTAPLNKAEISEYCRKHGVYFEQLKGWKKDCIAGCRNAPDKIYIRQSKQKEKEYKNIVKALEKDLRLKEKALAETAGLLTLKKKIQEIWGDPEVER
jgi:transposase-like protein